MSSTAGERGGRSAAGEGVPAQGGSEGPAAPKGPEAAARPQAPPADLREMLVRGKEFLKRHKLEEWRLDGELLVAHAVGLKRLELFLALDRPVSAAEVECARELLVRRAKLEPTAYLVGYREFYGLEFAVGPGVLIPRPESELLVDLGRQRLGARAGLADRDPARCLRCLDLGTGSGNLAIALLKHLPALQAVAIDRSPAALKFARSNGERHGIECRWLEGDGFQALPESETAFDLIVSNPPYVAAEEALAGERKGLCEGVRRYEPGAALFAPAGDPDHWVLRIVREGLPRLLPGGSALIELGFDQAARLSAPLAEAGLRHRFHRDLAGIERVLELEV